MVTHARVVFVNSHNHLTDTAGHDCRYRTANGHPLLPGYWYLVQWPDDVEEPLFDMHAHYSGPFDSERAARNELGALGVPVSTLVDAPPSSGAATARNPDAAFFSDWHCD